MKTKRNQNMENLTHSFRKTNLVLQLISESLIKSKTVMSWVAKGKRGQFLYRLFCPKEFFCICFILMYKVLNTLSEYTYFYISKNITLYNFIASNFTVESLQCIHKVAMSTWWYFTECFLCLWEVMLFKINTTNYSQDITNK